MLLFRMLFEPKTAQYTPQPQQTKPEATLNQLLLLCAGRT